jgi:hypothetical protein
MAIIISSLCPLITLPSTGKLCTKGPAPVNVAEYERYAQDNMSRNAHGYYASGSNDMITLRENRDAFARLRLMPKILIDVSNISMETTVLGEKVSSPLCIAPTAMQRMAHNDGECATSKAAARYAYTSLKSSDLCIQCQRFIYTVVCCVKLLGPIRL